MSSFACSRQTASLYDVIYDSTTTGTTSSHVTTAKLLANGKKGGGSVMTRES
jgi:hypothetical protein